jgi:hypothetical protein
MSSSRYHPQKETLVWANGNTFFMQKMTWHQSGDFLGKMFPILGKMFPRILEIGCWRTPRPASLPARPNDWRALRRAGAATQGYGRRWRWSTGGTRKAAVFGPRRASRGRW